MVVLLAVALAVAGLALVQRLVPLPIRQAHNTATGTIYAALYVMFGFSLFLVWQQYDAAQKSAESEAATVEELYQLAGGLPEPERGRVQDLAASYARVVVEEEWPLMRDGGTSSRGGARR